MENNDALKRIADALERIADFLDSNDIQTEIIDNLDNFQEIKYDVPEEIDVNILIDRLNERNISVKNFPSRDEENSSLDNISKFMGNRYEDIKDVYEVIKRHLNKHMVFILI